MTGDLDYTVVTRKIEKWLDSYLKQSRCKGFVVGVSGGLDSSVTAVLCRRVTSKTLALLLPVEQSSSVLLGAVQPLIKQFDIETKMYNLTTAYKSILEMFELTPDAPTTIPLANVKARLRMMALYFIMILYCNQNATFPVLYIENIE